MKLVKIFSVIIVILVIANITLSNRSLDESNQLSILNQEVTNLTHNNSIMRSSLAEAGSLHAIASRVEAAGFTENPHVVSLSSAKSVASR